MGRYLVIDREDKSKELILESLKSIDAQAQIESFASFDEFEKKITAVEPQELQNFWSFDAVVLDYGLLTYEQWPEKLTYLDNHNPKHGSILLTGYENTFTVTKYLKNLSIYNFIFKPFDSLILKESINLGLKPKKKASPIEMKSQSTTAFIALLKDVDLQTISELGFVTISDSEIPKGSLSKYYSPIFLHGKKQSVWAQCLISAPHPQQPGFFVNKFQFYSVDQTFLNSLRRYILAHSKNTASSALWNLNPPKVTNPIKIALISSDEIESKTIIENINRHFKNAKAETVKLDPNNKTPGNALEHKIVINLTELKTDTLKNYFKPDTQYLLITQSQPSDDDLKQLANEYTDIFIKPLDRSYFYKKLKIHCSALHEQEQSHLININAVEKIKVTNKVKISDISEIYVNLYYNRELSFKDFREFVFLTDDETQSVELPAFCHYTEKAQSNDSTPSFLHQFVFFSLTDQMLKKIRLWLLQNYIAQNQKEE